MASCVIILESAVISPSPFLEAAMRLLVILVIKSALIPLYFCYGSSLTRSS